MAINQSVGVPTEAERPAHNLPEFEVTFRFRARTQGEARLVALLMKRKLKHGELKALGLIVKQPSHQLRKKG